MGTRHLCLAACVFVCALSPVWGKHLSHQSELDKRAMKLGDEIRAMQHEHKKSSHTEKPSLEEMTCPGTPRVLRGCEDVWTLVGDRYCQMSNALQTSRILHGSAKTALGVVSYCTGVEAVVGTISTIGSCFAAFGSAITGRIDAANRHGLDALDSLRGGFDPTVAASSAAGDVSAAASSGTYSCVVSIITAYYAFRYSTLTKPGVLRCSSGSGAYNYMHFSRGYGEDCMKDFPASCAMPGQSRNRFLRTILADGGCPDSIKRFIRGADRAVYWHDLTRIAVDAAMEDVGLRAMMVTRAYSGAAKAIYEASTEKFVGLMIRQEELRDYMQQYFFFNPRTFEATPRKCEPVFGPFKCPAIVKGPPANRSNGLT